MKYIVRLHFPASNNTAEYDALINGLKIAIELGIRRLEIRGDSQLMVDQVMKESNYESETMAANCREIRKLNDKFDGLELRHIKRQFNEVAIALAKKASGGEPVPTGIFACDQRNPSISIPSPEGADSAPPT